MSLRLVAMRADGVRRQLAVRRWRNQELRAVGEEFRRAAFVGLDMRRCRADDAVVGLAERGQRQRIGRGAVEDEEHLARAFELHAKGIRRPRRPLVLAIGRSLAAGSQLPSPPRPPGKFRNNCRWQIAGDRSYRTAFVHLAVRAKLTKAARCPVCCRTGRISPHRGCHLAREQVGVERQLNSGCRGWEYSEKPDVARQSVPGSRAEQVPVHGIDAQDTPPRSRGVACARVMLRTFRPKRGRGGCRMPSAPAASCALG